MPKVTGNIKVEAHRVNTPIKLMAVLLGGAVLVSLALIGAACAISQPEWLPVLLTIAAISVFLGLSITVLVLIVKYRQELQNDDAYTRMMESKFNGFAPLSFTGTDSDYQRKGLVPMSPENTDGSVRSDLERRRNETYERNRGVFLVHSWRPSRTPGQVADIVIQIRQHRTGPLTDDQVHSVEYCLGPMFHDHPIIITDPHDGYRLDISAYGPMLCTARVNLQGSSEPIFVERYIDFDDATHALAGKEIRQ